MNDEIPPKFICDEMLKKLTRWLRIIGFDVTDPIVENDRELANISRQEKRVLLTRDKDLSNMKDIDVLRITSDDLMEQLEQILCIFPLDNFSPIITRCPSCNGELSVQCTPKIDPSSTIMKNIPIDVLTGYDKVFHCNSCEKVYWTGSHWTRITGRLEKFGVYPILPT